MTTKMPVPVRKEVPGGYEFRINSGKNRGQLHNDHGPARVVDSGWMGKQVEYWYFGRQVKLSNQQGMNPLRIPDCLKWAMIKEKAGNILLLLNTTPEMQEYAIRRKKNLVNKISNIDPRIQEKFAHFFIEVRRGTNYRATIYFHLKKMDREDGPAVVEDDEDEGEHVERWMCDGALNRIDGPAVIVIRKRINEVHKEWHVLGTMIHRSVEVPKAIKWMLLKGDPEVVTVLKSMDREMQEYLISVRPDLIKQIPGLILDLAKSHEHEVALAGLEI